MPNGTEGLSLNGFTTQIVLWIGEEAYAWCAWVLIPAEVGGVPTPSHQPSETLGSALPPSYNGDAPGQSSTQTQHAESERDDFGTIVTEVTVVTTHKRYRVEDA